MNILKGLLSPVNRFILHTHNFHNQSTQIFQCSSAFLQEGQGVPPASTCASSGHRIVCHSILGAEEC